MRVLSKGKGRASFGTLGQPTSVPPSSFPRAQHHFRPEASWVTSGFLGDLEIMDFLWTWVSAPERLSVSMVWARLKC